MLPGLHFFKSSNTEGSFSLRTWSFVIWRGYLIYALRAFLIFTSHFSWMHCLLKWNAQCWPITDFKTWYFRHAKIQEVLLEMHGMGFTGCFHSTNLDQRSKTWAKSGGSGNGHYSNSKKWPYNVHEAEFRSSCHVQSKVCGHEWRSLGKLVIEWKLEAIKIKEERMHASWLTQALWVCQSNLHRYPKLKWLMQCVRWCVSPN